jgi:hypothetical protein
VVRRSLIPALVLLALALGASDAYAAPFRIVGPPDAVVGQEVTFTAVRDKGNGNGDDLVWDFGDGTPTATGRVATHPYATAGKYAVTLSEPNSEGTALEVVDTTEITIHPVPDPPPPDPDPTPPPTDIPPAPTDPPSSGTDPPPPADQPAPSTGAVGGFELTPPPPPPAFSPLLMRPFPVVRIAGVVLPRGARVQILSVRAPRGSRIRVRCLGRGCPVGSMATTSAARLVRLRRFERRLAAGTRVRLFVRQKNRIGKYTSFLIRAGAPPKRVDLCLFPKRRSPGRCP